MDDTPRPHDVAIASAERRLAEEDEVQLKVLDPREMQGWCDSRIAEYESRIYALRSARNDAVPIHRFLPPELVLEIFANLLPTPTRRRHGLHVLRVCRRWRILVLDTPQFWVNLIGQQLEATKLPRLELGLLKFAIARSATLKFTLSWRGCGATAVDLFLPYTPRICSLNATFSNQDNSHMARFLESGLPFLEHLALTYNHRWLGTDPAISISPIAVRVSQFPRLQALHLVRSPLLVPKTPSLLRELDLLHVSPRSPGDPSAARRDIAHILDVLSFTKRLETLRLRYSLPEDILETSLSTSSRRIVQLPLLHTLVVRDNPRSVRVFLAYVELPPTTRLEVEIYTQRTDGTIIMPFPPGLNTAPADDASVGLVLRLDSSAVSHWETHVNGAQTLRLTVFRDWESRTDAGLMEYTREVMALFAPPRLVTSLTVSGGELAREDRAALLADLPHLTRLATTGPDGRLDGEVLSMLCEPGPEGEMLCPALEHLSFSWVHTSDRQVAWAQDRLRAQRRPHPDLRLATIGPEPHLHGQRGTPDDPKTWKPYGAAASHAFCRTVASFNLARSAAHSSRPLKSLAVAIRRPKSDYVHHQWDVPSVRTRLQEGLGRSVGSVSVAYIENRSA
ncbi:hypothetical protein LXA43DRAFT_353080 [Ganoderma leucocontextum]|nr:hypothetical protein LXA43DRAFT_353080 [Ganoderma leucocontextum]